MFVPGSNRPAELDWRMRAALADSLDYVGDALGDVLGAVLDGLRGASGGIRAHRVVPGVFGRYYRLVLAAQDGDAGTARRLCREIAEAAGRVPGFSADLYAEASLGAEKQLYGQVIDAEPGAAWLCEPGPGAGFEAGVQEALALIGAADPALADEVRGLVVQVVGAAPAQDSRGRAFGSVSSLMLWGLVVVNTERTRGAAALAGALVHEAAHLLLFAHSIDEPLVTNAIGERYASPLRADARPMDGVFHATFVSARLHHLRRRLLESGLAAEGEAQEGLARLRRQYFGGLETVRAHAALTGTGRRVLAESLDYMETV